jgi:hypothetical protein
VPKAEAVHHAGAEVFDDDGRGVGKPQEHLAALRMLQVDRDRPLARVLREKRNAAAAPIQFRVRAELSRQIAGPVRFDLDHVGAQVRELMAAERAGEHVRQVQHAHVAQRFHRSLLRACTRCAGRPGPHAECYDSGRFRPAAASRSAARIIR